MKTISFIALLILTFSCSREAIVDSSSPKAFDKSIERIKESLSGEELEHFSSHDFEKLDEKDRKEIDGMNSKRVNAYMHRRDIMIRKNLSDYFITSYEKNKKESERNIKEFEKLKIVSSKIVEKTSKFQVVLENNTKHVIKSVLFNATVSHPKRETVWHQGEIFTSIRTGLEVGEKKTILIHPMVEWSSRQIPDGYQLSLSLAEVRNHKDELVFPTATFSEEDKKSLERHRREALHFDFMACKFCE